MANLRNSQITTAPAKPFPACCVLISRSLATVSSNESLQLHSLKSSLHSLSYKTELCPLLITSRHEPHRKHISFIILSRLIVVNICLPRRCVAMAAVRTTESTVPLLLRERVYRDVAETGSFSRSLPNNGSTPYSTCLLSLTLAIFLSL
jgi:hypothetical protein